MADPMTMADAVSAARAQLAGLWPSATIESCDVLDDRGVVATLVYARAEGRLIVAARAVEIAPIEWPFGDASIAACVGVLPRSATPTVGEVCDGLAVVW